MKNIYIFLIITLVVVNSCELDNYDSPTAFLEGTVMYNNVPVGVRSGGTRLELWQDGFALKKKIDVYIQQDGTFSARLFNGEYKLVRLSGAPWENNTDSIIVQVKGKTVLDVPVMPYFIISGESFQKNGDEITSTCMVSKVGSRNIESLTLYIGVTSIVDANNNAQSHTLNTAALTDLSIPKNNTILLNSTLRERQYVFVRIGVKTVGVGERYYTDVKKIELH